MSRKTKSRRRYSAEQKAVIVRRHLCDKVPVSDLCDEYKIQPSVFYSWQKAVFANLEATFERQADPSQPRKRERSLERQVAALESRLTEKNAVIAEIGEEYVKLKKELGEL